MRLLRAPHIALLTVALAACSSDSKQTIDTAATYEVYGQRFEPATAVPAPAIVAEAEAFVGREIIVEGMADEGCASSSCWTSIDAGAGMRIDVFLADEKRDSLSVPENVADRRIVVIGTFDRGSMQKPTEGADAVSTLDTRLPATADTLGRATESTFTLHATGIMVEKTRS